MERLKNKYILEKYVKGLLLSYVGWYFFNALYLIIRYDALNFYANYMGENDYFIIHEQLRFAFIANGILAFILSWFSWNFYFFLERRAKTKVVKRLSLGLFTAIVVTCILFFLGDYIGENMYPDGFPYFNELTQQSFIIYAIYVLTATALLNSVFQLKDILGPELFKSVLRGNYYTPKEENRIFMFMDLYNSTTIAESLGHMKYSMLIQECYRTMTDAISHNKASVYQYVGDEIVLTWLTEKGIKNNRCIRLFFDIEATLKSRSEYFMKEFGVVPEFKAGIHSGVVATSQIGVIKREVAYHGDTVNATSRLQEKCKELGVSMLVSDALAAKLDLSMKDMGTHKFRGKHHSIKVFTVDKSNVPNTTKFTAECPSIGLFAPSPKPQFNPNPIKR
ncbi:adenylate/guanylate cyclase domain-containing protein [Flammeovirga kamogawensis]|uniref:Adenylate/guanylate cyclase domain-containing protein n=1 Tax=Flammeovirga kamogawensis TaxID=373891 RepID=A0ABX8H100_9BACT|nr:adenylate/guanylate cyclase domain-containing protein [Flammeovirga kamogawensis]MBB6463282.1 adenylate cyclase [Flammeovirga kamogawensis]QWG09568.1 adenylate/guanylate cyclase domain-containing protein [Flammeovirga kamogawensis]TRX65082.1 adenylate/guanylate cyclase domain-containing protein [Flammeovirga kamogawensis]